MRENRVGLVDRATGEVLEGAFVFVLDRPRHRRPFVMLWQDAIQHLVPDRRLGAQHWRVLMYLMAHLDYENYIHLVQSEIAEGVNIDKGNVSRVMRDLVKIGVVIEGPRMGRSCTYRLSPNLGWKGRVKSLQDERARRLALVHSSTAGRGGKDSHRRS